MIDFETWAPLVTYTVIGTGLIFALVCLAIHFADLAWCCDALLETCCLCIASRRRRQRIQVRELQQDSQRQRRRLPEQRVLDATNPVIFTVTAPNPAQEQGLSTATTLVNNNVPGQVGQTGDIELVHMNSARRRNSEDSSDSTGPAPRSPSNM
ncbi:hypothetical protein J1614_000342 [Plenodomus biglobosus]|nr:hypothetical protein J1614_000342 [Plenodomus biglobosus]